MMNNSATLMRDKLIALRAEKKINLKEITNKLSNINLPEWLQSEILQMVNYKKYERTTCPIEQALEAAVIHHIIKDLKDGKEVCNS